MTPAIGYAGAFLAGLASFASPCVLPLVPAYVSFMSGVSFDDAAAERAAPGVRLDLVVAALSFVTGFVLVFVGFGASASALGRVLGAHADLLAKISGAVVILAGLQLAGVLRIPMLARDARFHPRRVQAGPIGAFVMGLAFAFGWTPCVGPILAGILLIAANSGSIAQGIALLACYGFGIGVPFLLAALALGPFARLIARVRGKTRLLDAGVGGLMVVTGALIVSGSLASVSGWLIQTFPVLGHLG